MIREALREPATAPPRRARWLPTRIRSKLIFLHTTFSLGLAILLLLVLHPPLKDMLDAAEARQARVALEMDRESPGFLEHAPIAEATLALGSAEQLGIPPAAARRARELDGDTVTASLADGTPAAIRWDENRQTFVAASARITDARAAMNRLYLLLTIALLGVYGLIALTLELFILPRQVYRPIETLRAADDAVQHGPHEREIIPEHLIPPDELGEIMRSRNQSIVKLREQEEALASALQQVETIAIELKRKNHLLETARRNLADQDRLASLGMLSAGIAHELNTPLSVLKGCVEELANAPAPTTPERIALMARTVGRLERLSESLLDFARVRPPKTSPVRLRELVDEAWTLVSLDRGAKQIELAAKVDDRLEVPGDADRLTQVMVNLLRNAVDAMDGPGRITVTADESERDGRRWVSLTIADTGPGIDPDLLQRLFEPFQSTKLDSHGTGLGLAVAEGIVREHGGVLLARNGPHTGAVFEIMLPMNQVIGSAPPGEPDGSELPRAESRGIMA
jgi:signal transduction histidine kinase